MPRYDDIFQDATWDAHEETLGETVTIAGIVGTAVWEPEDQDEAFYPHIKAEEERGRLAARLSSFPTWSPSLSDTVQISGTTWAVKRIEQLTPVVVMQLFRVTAQRSGGSNTYQER